MEEMEINSALSLIYPQATVLIVSCDSQGRPNAMAADWHMRTSFNPPLFAVSVGRKRYTHQLLKETGSFSACFPSADMAQETLYCGTHSGREGDKMEDSGLRILPAKTISGHILDGCAVCLECKVVQSVETGDHTVFVGEIVSAHGSEKPLLMDFGGHELRGI